jgi:hypothetical protein
MKLNTSVSFSVIEEKEWTGAPLYSYIASRPAVSAEAWERDSLAFTEDDQLQFVSMVTLWIA